MGARRTDVLDIREILRRIRLGQTEREIARDLEVARKTVAKYRKWGQQEGLLVPEGLVEAGELVRRLEGGGEGPHPGPVSIVAPLREVVERLRQRKVEMRAIHQILRDEHEFAGSYSAVKRFVRWLEPRVPEAVVRVETAPGEEAQVDFGCVGKMVDPATGQLRVSWAFVMTLSWSRHQYVELVGDQTIGTWLLCHVHAFEFFGGVPRRVVIDNLKAAVVRAVVYDEVLTRAYRDLAEHYGFVVSPCRPRTPQHKGKVEQGGVHYVKRNALAGRSFRDRAEGNKHVGRWVMEVAGQRDHGTTHEKPLVRFEEVERRALQELPPVRYELVVWKKAKLHPDCHVVYERSYYSVPHRLIGQVMWVRGTPRRVEIFHEHERVASHERAVRAGTWRTVTDHLPPAKVAGLMAAPVLVREKAARVGPAAAELVERLLEERPLDRLRAAQGILKLAERFTAARLEGACRRALLFGELSYGAIKRILARGLDLDPPQTLDRGPLPQTCVYARPAGEILPGGGGPWN
jgi:transposase